LPTNKPYKRGDGSVSIRVRDFDLDQILDCGQSFRWEKTGDNEYSGVAFGLARTVSMSGDELTVHGAATDEFNRVWRMYFDLDRDYTALKATLAEDPIMAKAVEYAPGIRVLRQEPWEALCSFILSQNNNIPRIKGLVKRLCEGFGQPIEAPTGTAYSFPGPEVLAGKTVEDLAPIRAGFRAKYILDAAEKVATDEVPLKKLALAETKEAKAKLQAIHGVGPKVADCTLLYGLAHADAVPEDVWIKRALAALYPGGFPKRFAPFAGIAQQYLFHYVRTSSEALNG
jgi:N-glycosylase/DNA lyase